MKTIAFPNERLIPEIVRLVGEGHTVTLRLKGRSMRPFLEDNRDIALLAAPKPPAVGDPVLAEITPGHYVLHRIVAIDGERITLRGDGNIGTEQCSIQDIKASVRGFYRKGRQTLDSTDGRKWRIYSWIWMHLLPIRRYLLAISKLINHASKKGI